MGEGSRSVKRGEKNITPGRITFEAGIVCHGSRKLDVTEDFGDLGRRPKRR